MEDDFLDYLAEESEGSFFKEIFQQCDEGWYYLQINIKKTKDEQKEQCNEKIKRVMNNLTWTLYPLKKEKKIRDFYFNVQWYENEGAHINLGLSLKDGTPDEIGKSIRELKEKDLISGAILRRSPEECVIEEMKAIATHAVLFHKSYIPVLAKLAFLSHHMRNIGGTGINEESLIYEAEQLSILRRYKTILFRILYGYIKEMSIGINENQAKMAVNKLSDT